MKKRSFLLLLTVLSLFGMSQTVSIPGHSLGAITRPGLLKLTTTITNTATSPLEFGPLVKWAGTDSAFWSEENLLASLSSMITDTDREERKLQAVRIIATKLFKTPLFVNARTIFSEVGSVPQDSILVRKYSLMGATNSLYQNQCYGYQHLLVELLLKLNVATISEIRMINLRHHGMPEILYRGGWVWVDVDPGEPGFMFPNPANANGWASVFDLVADTTLINPAYRYKYVSPNGDSTDMIPGTAWSDYVKLFDTIFVNTSINFTTPTYDFSGKWKLPPGGSITWTEEFQNKDYLVDTAREPGHSFIVRGLPLWASYGAGDTSLLDTIKVMVADLLDVTKDSVTKIMIGEGSQLIFTNNTSIDLLRKPWETWDTTIPMIDVHVLPAEPQGCTFGQDLSLPFMVANVSTDGPVYFKDTTIGSGCTDFHLYSDFGHDEVFGTTVGKINYLAYKGLINAGTNVTFTCEANKKLFPFEKGFSIDMLGAGTDSLEVTLTRSDSVQIPTGIASLLKTNDASLQVYPNPSNDMVIISGISSNEGSANIYTVCGQIAGQCSVIKGTSHIDVAAYAPGMYFVRFGTKTGRFVVER